MAKSEMRSEGWRWLTPRLVVGMCAATVSTMVASSFGVMPVSASEPTSTTRYVVLTDEFADARDAVESVGGEISTSYPALHAISAELTPAEASTLQASPSVEAVEVTTLNDKALREQLSSFQGSEFTGVAPIAPVTLKQVDDAINNDGDGKDIDVALVDTGVAPVDGLDKSDTIVNGPDLSFDYQGGAPAGVDAYGHGTHLAGIIGNDSGGDDEGIAKDARILNMKVGAFDGTVDVSQVIAAIDWVTQHRRDPGMNVRVINLSYGTDALQPADIDPLSHAVESAWRNGIVVVVAAGNNGGLLTNPAINPYVLTVGAADLKDPGTRSDDTVADFSSVGTFARGVDVVAPGVSIRSLRATGSYVDVAFPSARIGTTYFKGSGSSQAAAVASAAVANLLDKRPTLTPDQVKGLLKATARQLPRAPQLAQGAGMINVKAAVDSKMSLKPFAQVGPPSTGLGSLELARGGTHLISPDGIELFGEFDIMGAPWNPLDWAPKSSLGEAWSGSSWNGNVLTGTGWTDSSTDVWAGSTWRSAEWVGTTWTGSTWRGSTWRGSTWRDNSWVGSTWTGSTWRGSTWRGSTWRTLQEEAEQLPEVIEAPTTAPTETVIPATGEPVAPLESEPPTA